LIEPIQMITNVHIKYSFEINYAARLDRKGNHDNN